MNDSNVPNKKLCHDPEVSVCEHGAKYVKNDLMTCDESRNSIPKIAQKKKKPSFHFSNMVTSQKTEYYLRSGKSFSQIKALIDRMRG